MAWWKKKKYKRNTSEVQTATIKPFEFDWDEFERLFEESQKEARRRRKKEEKQAKKNIKHLVKRSKELGRPIPDMLLFFAASAPPMYVGSDFVERYREWF